MKTIFLFITLFLVHCTEGDNNNSNPTVRTDPRQQELEQNRSELQQTVQEKQAIAEVILKEQPILVEAGSAGSTDICANLRNSYDLFSFIYDKTPVEELKKRGKCLLARGDDVNKRDEKGYSPICYAIINESLTQMEWFLNNGAHANEWCNLKSKSSFLIHMATVHTSDPKFLELLIKHGAFLELRDTYNETPLMKASERGYLESVKLLVTKGANLLATNPYAKTALDLAINRNHQEVVQYLTPLVEKARSPLGSGPR